MASGWWTTGWWWNSTGWALAGAGVVLLVWALFWDRSRGRRRCPKCWYDMSGVVVVASGDENASASRDHQGVGLPRPACPEWGRRTTREHQLKRTRRSGRVMTLGLAIVALGYVAWAMPRILGRGWVGAVPTSVLVAGSSFLREPDESEYLFLSKTTTVELAWEKQLFLELMDHRTRANETNRLERRLVLWRMLRGDALRSREAGHGNLSLAWKVWFLPILREELGAEWREGRPRRSLVMSLLERGVLMPRLVVAGEPVWIAFDEDVMNACRLWSGFRLIARLRGSAPAWYPIMELAHDPGIPPWREIGTLVGVSDRGITEVAMDVRTGWYTANLPWKPTMASPTTVPECPPWSGTLRFPVRCVSTPEEAKTAVPTPPEAVASEPRPVSITLGYRSLCLTDLWYEPKAWPDDPDYVYQPSQSVLSRLVKGLPGVTVGALVRITRDGKPIAETRAWWRWERSSGGEWKVIPSEGELSAAFAADVPIVPSLDTYGSGFEPPGAWAVELISDAAESLHDAGSDRRWEGRVAIPAKFYGRPLWSER